MPELHNKSEVPTNRQIIKKVLDTLKGHHVVARNDLDGFYYPGNVSKAPVTLSDFEL